MAATYQFGAGWETGSMYGAPNFVPGGGAEPTAIETGTVHTGNYAIEQRGGGSVGLSWFDLTGLALSELWFGLWVHPHINNGYTERSRVRFYLSTGERHEVRLQSDGAWDTYINGVKQENGSVTPGGNWQNLQIHLLVADSGELELKVDGNTDTTFSGDTQPGASATIDRLEFWAQSGDWIIDDVVIATVDYPGDIRFDVVLPDGDDSVQWTRSAEASNYLTVDERPPSDSDYNTADADTEKDVYTLADWSGTDKTPVFVTQYARAKKDDASAHQLELIFDDGTESIGTPFDLTTGFLYYNRMSVTKPSSGAWDETAIDALKIGMRAQLV